jgi:hypothetical protein
MPVQRGLTRIHRRRSGSAATTADCIASNVSRATLLANNEASSGVAHERRRSTAVASPLIEFIAAATATSIVGHAARSASYAALRTAGSASVASPRTAVIGRWRVPPGAATSAVSWDVRSRCRRRQASDPVVASSA